MNPILDFLIAKHVEYQPPGEHRHVRRGWIGINPCPSCGSTSFHAAISEDGRSASCWRCGRLDPINLLAAAARCKPREVLAPILSARGIATQETPSQPPSGRYIPPTGVGPLLPAHRKYLKARGFDPDDLSRLWSVEGIGLAGKLTWRLFIPFLLDGRPVSWTTRAIGTSGRRYVSASPEQETVSHKEILYGEDYARHAVVVVEGPLDAWAIGPGAVAVAGLVVTDAQVDRIAAYPMRAVCFDAEPPAKLRQETLVRRLASFPGETVSVDLETGPDAAEAEDGEIREIRKAFLGV